MFIIRGGTNRKNLMCQVGYWVKEAEIRTGSGLPDVN